ncbi:glycosyltransferase, partial [bacterium]|nr:glycosyltransferase [bacterium]
MVRNAGIRTAVGDILTFLDADDLYHPDRLKDVAEAFQKNNLFDVIFHDLSLVDENDDIFISSQIHSKVNSC